MKKIVIIGGGAAGLMAACAANFKYKDGGAEITVLEKNERPGRKLMITGKGRCNVTNNCEVPELMANVPKNGKFLYSAFSGFHPKAVMMFFESLGVPLKTERGSRVFPVSDRAVDIVDALVNAARRGGTRIIHGTAEEILTENGEAVGVKLKNGDTLSADSVILATGGISYPLTGSTGDGYKMAAACGHTVIEPTASLVPLEVHEGFCERLAGLSLKNVTLTLFESGKKKPIFSEMGEMLFTHFGISGPLTLSASAHMRRTDKGGFTAKIDLKPALSPEQLDRRILRDFEGAKNKAFSNSLDGLLPKSLIPVVIKLTGVEPAKKVNEITRAERMRLCEALKGLTLHITGKRPIEEAIITSGGISVKEIEPKTMASRLVSGLYFAGEIIDVDAYTGGFNLQIAFSTGFAAGSNA